MAGALEPAREWRDLAPYVGVTWNNRWGRTTDLAQAAGEDTGGARFVSGLRFWF